MKLSFINIIIVISVFSICGELVAQGPGTLDPDFNNNGIVLSNFENSTYGYAIELQSDGKIVASGSVIKDGIENIFIARYLPNGPLDGSFGNSGTGINIIENSYLCGQIYDIAIQEDGKIIVVGVDYSCEYGYPSFVIFRFNGNGLLDTSFGQVGKKIVEFIDNAVAFSVIIQGDNRLLISGMVIRESTGNRRIAMCRLNTDGTMDTSFGTGGKLYVNANGGSDYGRGTLVLNDQIYCTAISLYGSQKSIKVYCLNLDGTLNLSFGDNGQYSKDIDIEEVGFMPAVSITGLNNVNICVAFSELVDDMHQFSLFSLSPNGELDASFGDNGKVLTSMSGDNFPYAVICQEDGKILVGGSHYYSSYKEDFCIARFFEDGQLDSSFGNYNGVTYKNISEYSTDPKDFLYSMCIQPQGGIFAAGYSRTGSNTNSLAIAKFYSGLEVDVKEIKNSNLQVIRYSNPIVNRIIDIQYTLIEPSIIKINLYDGFGNKLKQLIDEHNTSGNHSKSIIISQSLAAGLYFLEISAKNQCNRLKLIIL